MYPLLAKLGDESELVSDAALKSLRLVSASCGYGDGKDLTPLLAANADRLADTLGRHLRHLSSYPKTPEVLEAILSHTGIAMLGFVEDTLEGVLERPNPNHNPNSNSP